MARHLYVYYRVPVEHASQMHQRAQALLKSISRECGIVARLQRRPEEKDGRQTWMEVYEAVPAGFEETLERAAEREGMTGLIDGQRHTEIFVDVT
ncbi:MAG TPA: DUF4936 family protein [Noviherbaspirillum sp.]|nr:DUF4936 family protein [Noviherbaspirillum sp.]